MRIVVAGAGTVGLSIAEELLAHGHEVALIDRSPDRMKISQVPQADWILADACSISSLTEAEVNKCEVMVAATGDDKANLVISLLSKTEFAVPRVVARVNSPKNEWMFDETWGVDMAVSTPRIMTSLVEEAVSVGSLVKIFTFHQSATTMHAVTIPDESPLLGVRLGDIDLPATTVISALLRDDRPYSLDPDITIEAGDELILLIAATGIAETSAISRIINPTSED